MPTVTSPPTPTIVLPDPAPAPVPSPVIVAPAAEPQATVQSAPEPAASTAPRATTTRTNAPSASARTATAAPAPREAAPAASTAPAEPVTPPPAEVAPAAAPVAVEEPAAAPVSQDEGSDNTLAIAGLLGIVALGGAGIYAATRRRRTVYEEPAAYEPVNTVASPPARLTQPAAAPLPVREEPLVLGAAQVRNDAPRPSEPALRIQAATFDGPVPAEADERRALLERMVDEAPSDANPFTSRKARLRRARLILQHREAQGTPSPSVRTTLDRTQPFGTRTLVDA